MNEVNEILSQLTTEEKEKLRAKKVLVTGGGGFLGSWIGETLLALDTKVYCLDNFSTGVRRNIESLKNNKNFRLIEGDVENFETDESFDFVFHFASRPAPDDYVLHPVETLKANSIGTLKMLELSKKSNATFVYASSSEVYGDAEVIPTPEDYWGKVNPIGVRSCYDEGKRND
jgi:UDP-glucuronate decarboxylase